MTGTLTPQPLNVLVVEDQFAVRQLLVLMLKDAGVQQVWEAGSGAQAMLLFDAHQPDLVLMDVILPDCSGLDVVQRMREADTHDGTHAWTPIVLISSLGEEQAIWQGIEAGGDDYLTKPISPVILAAKLRAMQRLLHTRRQLDALSAELRTANQRLNQLVEIDALTELMNRRGLDRILATELRAALRAEEPLSLILCDIDHFKPLNDARGHLFGDEVLRQVAQMLRSICLRPRDAAARYGGEEFLLVLPNTPASGAMTLARGITQLFRHCELPHPASPVAPHVTLSGGVVTLDAFGDPSAASATVDGLLQLADAALYAAKLQGRNRFLHAREWAATKGWAG